MHGFALVIVFHVFASGLHRGEQRGLGVACWRFGFEALGFGCLSLWRFTRIDLDQYFARLLVFFLVHLFAVNGLPPRLDQHLAAGLEVVLAHLAHACGVHIFSRRIEHRHKTAHHKVVELLLGV